MKIWLDNQLPPALAEWMGTTFGIECAPVRDMNLHRSSDLEIFQAAHAAQATIMTKDADFVGLVLQRGTPPILRSRSK